MKRSFSRSLILFASGLLACSSGGSNPPEQPAPAPATATATASAAAAGPAEHAAWFAGEWTFEAAMGSMAMRGSWRITFVNGRWTGVVAPDAFPPSPVKSMTMTGPNFTFLVDFNGEEYTFRGRLENERTINGTVAKTGAQGRLSARKR